MTRPHSISRHLKATARKIADTSADLWDHLTGRWGSLTPPRRLVKEVGGGDFLNVGRDFLQLFRKPGGLLPGHSVLDVGCGVGRMALPLTTYLGPKARYEGFDVNEEEIRWCQTHITPRCPNFRFRVSPVYNKVYGPRYTTKASNYRFPFDDRSFDFVILTSVFTHMLPGDLQNYLSETTRVLKSGGRCFITYFLLNPESETLMSSGRSALHFRFDIGGCRTTNPDMPEVAVAYQESFLRGLYHQHGLHIEPPVEKGAWCGRTTSRSFQDIVVAVKVALPS